MAFSMHNDGFHNYFAAGANVTVINYGAPIPTGNAPNAITANGWNYMPVTNGYHVQPVQPFEPFRPLQPVRQLQSVQANQPKKPCLEIRGVPKKKLVSYLCDLLEKQRLYPINDNRLMGLLDHHCPGWALNSKAARYEILPRIKEGLKQRRIHEERRRNKQIKRKTEKKKVAQNPAKKAMTATPKQVLAPTFEQQKLEYRSVLAGQQHYPRVEEIDYDMAYDSGVE